MHAHRTQHVDHELWKWLLMILLALLLVLLAAQTTAAEPIDPTLLGTMTSRVESVLLAEPSEGLAADDEVAVLPVEEARRWQTPTARRLWDIFALHEKSELYGLRYNELQVQKCTKDRLHCYPTKNCNRCTDNLKYQ